MKKIQKSFDPICVYVRHRPATESVLAVFKFTEAVTCVSVLILSVLAVFNVSNKVSGCSSARDYSHKSPRHGEAACSHNIVETACSHSILYALLMRVQYSTLRHGSQPSFLLM